MSNAFLYLFKFSFSLLYFGELLCLICIYILEKAMAPHSSTLAWKIPWTEEPGRLQTMGSGRVGQDWATSLSLFPFMHWRRKWQPLQCSCLENPRDGGAWWAVISGVAQSRTRLKWLSSSSSMYIYIYIWRRTWQPTAVFLPGESHGRRSLADYSSLIIYILN